MVNKLIDEPRSMMLVPTAFRDRVFKEAKKAGVKGTVYLQGKCVVPIEKVPS